MPEAMRRKRSALSDLLFVGGIGSVIYGVAQWSPAAAWIVAGSCSLIIAWSLEPNG